MCGGVACRLAGSPRQHAADASGKLSERHSGVQADGIEACRAAVGGWGGVGAWSRRWWAFMHGLPPEFLCGVTSACHHAVITRRAARRPLERTVITALRRRRAPNPCRVKHVGPRRVWLAEAGRRPLNVLGRAGSRAEPHVRGCFSDRGDGVHAGRVSDPAEVQTLPMAAQRGAQTVMPNAQLAQKALPEPQTEALRVSATTAAEAERLVRFVERR
eukprot:363564-Chlamydomonas_euryale.AAC.6